MLNITTLKEFYLNNKGTNNNDKHAGIKLKKVKSFKPLSFWQQNPLLAILLGTLTPSVTTISTLWAAFLSFFQDNPWGKIVLWAVFIIPILIWGFLAFRSKSKKTKRNMIGKVLCLLSVFLYVQQVLYRWSPVTDLVDQAWFFFVISIPTIIGMPISLRRKHEGDDFSVKWGLARAGIGALIWQIGPIGYFITQLTFGTTISGSVINQAAGMNITLEMALEMPTEAQMEAIRVIFWIFMEIITMFPPFFITLWVTFGLLMADDMEEAGGSLTGILAAIVYVLLIWLFSLVNINIRPVGNA